MTSSIRRTLFRTRARASVGLRRFDYSGRRLLGRCVGPNPYRLFWVPTPLITSVMRERIDDQTIGCQVPGDWDLDAIPLESTILWRAFDDHFIRGRSWTETELLPSVYVPDFANAPRRYANMTPEEFARRGAELDSLWTDLSSAGWLDHRTRGTGLRQEMGLCIGRSGQMSRNSAGLHRLVMSHLLGLERVPARIVATHDSLKKHDLAAITESW